MKTVVFETPARPRSPGSLIDWARCNQIFFRGLYFPPFGLSRSFSKKGRVDHGMSGFVRWEPFELEPDDYEEIKKYFKGLNDPNLKFADPEPHIESEIDWQVWTFQEAFGVPEMEHRQLLVELERAKRRLDDALSQEDQARVQAAHAEYVQLGEALSRFLARHVR